MGIAQGPQEDWRVNFHLVGASFNRGRISYRSYYAALEFCIGWPNDIVGLFLFLLLCCFCLWVIHKIAFM